MLKKLFFIIMFIGILFIFSGCKQFFTFNLFDGLDYVPLPTAEKLNEKPAAETVNDLQESMESDSYVAALENDPEALAAVQTYLEDVYTNPDVDADVQAEAAVLAADLELAVTGGDEFLDGVWTAYEAIGVMLENTSTPGEQQAQLAQTIIADIIPDSVKTDKTAFTAMIVGVLEAGAIYQELGAIITDPGFDSTQGAITGGIVFNAAVTGLIQSVVTNMLLPAYQDPAAAAEVIWTLYNTPPADIGTLLGSTIDPNADFGSTFLTDMTYLNDLALAAGADLASLLGQAPPAVAP